MRRRRLKAAVGLRYLRHRYSDVLSRVSSWRDYAPGELDRGKSMGLLRAEMRRLGDSSGAGVCFRRQSFRATSIAHPALVPVDEPTQYTDMRKVHFG